MKPRHIEGTSFTENCQLDSIPQELYTLISGIIDGTSLFDQSHESQPHHRATLAIYQAIVYNVSSNNQHTGPIQRLCHTRETPFTVYVAMKIHSVTGCNTVIRKLYDYGICTRMSVSCLSLQMKLTEFARCMKQAMLLFLQC